MRPCHQFSTHLPNNAAAKKDLCWRWTQLRHRRRGVKRSSQWWHQRCQLFAQGFAEATSIDGVLERQQRKRGSWCRFDGMDRRGLRERTSFGSGNLQWNHFQFPSLLQKFVLGLWFLEVFHQHRPINESDTEFSTSLQHKIAMRWHAIWFKFKRRWSENNQKFERTNCLCSNWKTNC